MPEWWCVEAARRRIRRECASALATGRVTGRVKLLGAGEQFRHRPHLKQYHGHPQAGNHFSNTIRIPRPKCPQSPVIRRWQITTAVVNRTGSGGVWCKNAPRPIAAPTIRQEHRQRDFPARQRGGNHHCAESGGIRRGAGKKRQQIKTTPPRHHHYRWRITALLPAMGRQTS